MLGVQQPAFQTVVQETFGGLYTEADPSALPAGASPYCVNCDFEIGSVFQRPGLLSEYTFTDNTIGPNPCTVGSTVATGLAPWINPNNIAVPDSSYATCNISSGVVLANKNAGFGTSVASTRAPWSNANGVTGSGPLASATTSFLTSFATAPLAAQGFGFAISQQPTGILVIINASCTVAGTITAQLLRDGLAVGTTKSFNLTTTSSAYNFGNDGDLWGTHMTPADFNSVSWGVQITCSSNINGAVFSVGGVSAILYINGSDPLIASVFNFAVPNIAVQGIIVGLGGNQSSTGEISAQLTNGAGTPVGNILSGFLPGGSSILNLGGSQFSWGANLTAADVNSPLFKVILTANGTGTFNVDVVYCTVFQVGAANSFNYIKTFAETGGEVLTLALSSSGQIYQEDVNNTPGVMVPVYGGLTPNGFAESATLDDREFLAFSNLLHGTDSPLTYTPTSTGSHFDRLSQVGPGAPPSASTTSSGETISTITQTPAVHPPIGTGTAGSWVGWNDSPQDSKTKTPGNVLTFVFPTAFVMPSWVVVGANIVIAGLQAMNGYDANNGVGSNPAYYTITTVGQPIPGQQYYDGFTVTIPQSGYYSNRMVGSPTFQSTLATMTTAAQVPDLEVGGQFQVSGTGGAPPAGYDATWTVVQTPNAAQMVITATSLTGNVATYSFTIVTGTPPVIGQAVTVTGTLNGNGIFNVVQGIITAVSGGTFSLNVVSANISSAAESGSGIIFGTIFTFDAFQIIGNKSGGSIVTVGLIGIGIRKVCYSFLTRNGYVSKPSPILTFDVPSGASSITISNLLTGPSNVVARIVHLTAANGGNFYNIPDDVPVISNGQTIVNTSTWVEDNTSTSIKLSFSDGVLLSADQIDIQGNNLFECSEVGSSVMVVPYSQRMFVVGEQNKITNMLNWSFDGGIGVIQGNISGNEPSGAVNQTYPAGWVINTEFPYFGSMVPSPLFGSSYQISNQSGSTQSVAGLITQNAFQDEFGVPIIQASTTYSVRVTASLPSGPLTAGAGNLVVDLYSPSFNKAFGTFSIPLANLSNVMAIYTGPFDTLLGVTMVPFSPVPNDLQVRIWTQNIPNGAIVQIDRIEPFPTEQPNLDTQITGSYAGNFEALDEVTGVILGTTINQQPIVSVFVLFDTLYMVKSGSLLGINDNNSTEPSGWNVPRTISPAVGAAGPYAVTTGIDEPNSGEEWAIMAGRSGAYIFNGGQPIKLMSEIQSLWNWIYWKYGYTIWVKNDITNRRILFGVPMRTQQMINGKLVQNPWIDTGVVPDTQFPTHPNIVLALNYKQLNTAGALADSPEVHRSYSGKLLASEIVRKWSVWSIEAPCAAFVTRPDGTAPLFLGNSESTGKIYGLDEELFADDGSAILQEYITSPFVSKETGQGLQMGMTRYDYDYTTMNLDGGIGVLSITTLPNSLDTPFATTLAPDLVLPASTNGDVELPLNETGSRMYLDFVSNSVGSGFQISSIVMAMHKSTWSPIRGGNG